jgi:hypothetical protein
MDYVVAVFTRWKPIECKASLLASAKRAQLGRNKVLVQQKKLENEIAELLQKGREEKARIKAETLVQMQKMETAYDILETLAELLQTRLQYISECKECPPDLVTPIASCIYAAKRLQVPEFKTALKQFNAKFGVNFTRSHADNESGQVATNLVDVLLITPPKEGEIHDILTFVAEKHGIDWVPPRRPETTMERESEAAPLRGSNAVAIVSADSPILPVSSPPPQQCDTPSNPPPPIVQSKEPTIKADETPKAPDSPVNDPQYEDLMARLKRLKLDQPPKPPTDTKPNTQ